MLSRQKPYHCCNVVVHKKSKRGQYNYLVYRLEIDMYVSMEGSTARKCFYLEKKLYVSIRVVVRIATPWYIYRGNITVLCVARSSEPDLVCSYLYYVNNRWEDLYRPNPEEKGVKSCRLYSHVRMSLIMNWIIQIILIILNTYHGRNQFICPEISRPWMCLCTIRWFVWWVQLFVSSNGKSETPTRTSVCILKSKKNRSFTYVLTVSTCSASLCLFVVVVFYGRDRRRTE